MLKHKGMIRFWSLGALLLAAWLSQPAFATVTPEPGYAVENDIASPDPAPLSGWGEFAVYEHYLLYVAQEKNLYAYDMETGQTQLFAYLGLISTDLNKTAVDLTATKEGYLYFHGQEKIIYKLDMQGLWPLQWTSYPTNCDGKIASLAVNPWTGGLWFASVQEIQREEKAMISSYDVSVYEVYPNFKKKRKAVQYDTISEGLQGPMAWQAPYALLTSVNTKDDVGELRRLLPNGDDAYFFSSSEKIKFDSPLTQTITSLVPAWDSQLYVAVKAVDGSGGEIYKIKWDEKILVATSDKVIDKLFFDGETLYFSELTVAKKAAGGIAFGAITRTESDPFLALAKGWTATQAGAILTGKAPEVNSVAAYGHNLLFSRDDENVGYMDLTSGKTPDAAFLAPGVAGMAPAGFAMSQDSKYNWLYFFDANQEPRDTVYTYRRYLTSANPSAFVLAKEVPGFTGDIGRLVVHPETKVLYVGASNEENAKMIVSKAVSDGINYTPTFLLEFDKPHGGEIGPLVFKDANTLYFGEKTTDMGYFHAVNLESKTVTPDAVVIPGGLEDAIPGPFGAIYAASGDSGIIYEIQGGSVVTAAAALEGPVVALACEEGALVAAWEPSPSKAGGDLAWDYVWQPQQWGLRSDQAGENSDTSTNADMTVRAAIGNGYLGIQSGAPSNTVIEFLEALDPAEVSDVGCKERMPLGMIQFRAQLEGVITATVVVYFSQALPVSTSWWKYDQEQGWYKHRFATLSSDRRSITLKITDGGEGDADGVRNGYVTDPGGPGFPLQNSGVKDYPGFTSDCFAGACPLSGQRGGDAAAVIVLMACLAAVQALRRRKTPGTGAE